MMIWTNGHDLGFIRLRVAHEYASRDPEDAARLITCRLFQKPRLFPEPLLHARRPVRLHRDSTGVADSIHLGLVHLVGAPELETAAVRRTTRRAGGGVGRAGSETVGRGLVWWGVGRAGRATVVKGLDWCRNSLRGPRAGMVTLGKIAEAHSLIEFLPASDP